MILCTKDRQWSLRDGYFFILLVTHGFSRLRSSNHGFRSVCLQDQKPVPEPIIQTKEMMDEQAELDEMARESMFALNRENGMSEEEARELDSSFLRGPDLQSGPDSESETLQRIYKGMTGEEADELTQMGDVSPDKPMSSFKGTIYTDGTLDESPESQSEPAIDMSGNQSQNYQDFFARLINSMAQIVGKDTELGSKLSNFANELEGKDINAEQYRSDVDPAYYDLNKLHDDEEQGQKDRDKDLENDQEIGSEKEKGIEPDRESSDSHRGVSESDIESIKSKLPLSKEALSEDFAKLGAPGADMSGYDKLADGMCNGLEKAVSGLDMNDDSQKQESADKHMNLIRGLNAYDQVAKDCIQDTYKDDLDKMQQAMTGLERTLETMVPKAYDAVHEDDKKFDLLSDADKKELDDLKFDGLDMKYSEYTAKKDSADKSKSDDLDLFGNAGLDDPLESDNKSKSESKKDLGKSVGSKPKDRGAEAEQAFASQLEKFREQQNGLSMSL